MRTLASSLAIVLALACGADPPALWRSGSRLRARVQRADTGAALFVAWHDTVLGSDCTFVADAEWNLYCVPRTGSAYLDDTCSTLGVTSVVGTDLPRYTLAPSAPIVGAGGLGGLGGLSYASAVPSTCVARPDTVEVREVDLAHTTTAAFVRDASGACTRLSLTPVTAAPILGTVSLSTFVSATLTRAPVGSRLLQYVLHADDGAEQRLPVFDDPVVSSLCRFAHPERGGACVPEEAARASPGSTLTPFADPSCTTPTAQYPLACTRPPRWVAALTYADDSCTAPTAELRDIGSEVSALFRVDPTSGACQPYDPTSVGALGALGGLGASRSFELGASLGADRLAIGAIGLVGSGALRLRTIDVEGVPTVGVSLRAPDGRSCGYVPFDDHVARCVPGPTLTTGSPPVLGFFEDAACTAPIGQGPASCAGTLQALVEMGASGVRVHGIEVLPPATRYERVAGACVPTTPSSPQSIFYRVGDVLPMESFTVITTVVE